MQAEGWPRIVCERLERESLTDYRERSARIIEIMEGFRMSRFRGDLAERMERELVRLQEQGLERLSA